MADPRTTILGDPEMLERLRAWAEPIYGGPMSLSGPGSLQALQEIIEDAAKDAGMIPQYRRTHDA